MVVSHHNNKAIQIFYKTQQVNSETYTQTTHLSFFITLVYLDELIKNNLGKSGIGTQDILITFQML